jgi:hypothetical protein
LLAVEVFSGALTLPEIVVVAPAWLASKQIGANATAAIKDLRIRVSSPAASSR